MVYAYIGGEVEGWGERRRGWKREEGGLKRVEKQKQMMTIEGCGGKQVIIAGTLVSVSGRGCFLPLLPFDWLTDTVVCAYNVLVAQMTEG